MVGRGDANGVEIFFREQFTVIDVRGRRDAGFLLHQRGEAVAMHRVDVGHRDKVEIAAHFTQLHQRFGERVLAAVARANHADAQPAVGIDGAG